MRHKQRAVQWLLESLSTFSKEDASRDILSYLRTSSHEDVVLGAALSTRDYQEKVKRAAEKLTRGPNMTGSLS